MLLLSKCGQNYNFPSSNPIIQRRLCIMDNDRIQRLQPGHNMIWQSWWVPHNDSCFGMPWQPVLLPHWHFYSWPLSSSGSIWRLQTLFNSFLKISCVVDRPPSPVLWHSSCFELTSKAQQLESKVWLLQLGSQGFCQLDVLPPKVTGLPAVFKYHPFCFVDFKEQAWICK